MDVKELMIGDWVNFLVDVVGGDTENDPQIEEYEPMKINTVASWGVDGEITSEVGAICSPEQLKPIPLTVEILNKNGFTTLIDVGDLTYYESADKRIKATNCEGMKNTGNEWSIHIDTEDMCTMGYCEVTYVHELQHLLKLCGITKDIKI